MSDFPVWETQVVTINEHFAPIFGTALFVFVFVFCWFHWRKGVSVSESVSVSGVRAGFPHHVEKEQAGNP